MDIAIRAITFVVIDIFIALIMDYIVPILRKKEKELEEQNGAIRVVKMEWKKQPAMWLMPVCGVIANLAGIVLIAVPNLVEELLGVDILVIAIVWWIVLLFDDVVMYFTFIVATYDDETITVKKPFCKAKTYRLDDVIKYSTVGNLRIETKTGKFTLFNAMSGTQTLRSFLVQRESGSFKEKIA